MFMGQRYHKLLEIRTQIPLPTSAHIHVTDSLSIKNNNNTTFHRPLELPPANSNQSYDDVRRKRVHTQRDLADSQPA
jgi:hypothetical protein